VAETPSALDLARLVVALDERMTWPASAWKHADALRAAAHAVLTATGHADEISDPDADADDDRNYTGDDRLREFGLEFDPVNSFDPTAVAA